jgi:precorrin-6x reductase
MILVLGGTSDARALADELRGAGHDVLLSTVSDYGARLAAAAGGKVRSGALDEAELSRLVEDSEAVVDATHPFAARISPAAAAACARSARPYLRFERPAAVLGETVVRAADAADAARRAVELAGDGAVLLTVGSKTVDLYVRAARAADVRLVARVLPSPESLAACAAAGLEPRDVIAMQGPTSAELDAALLHHLGATVLVTKESGDAGGLGEKLRAAELAGATAVVVERPGPAAAAIDAQATADPVASPPSADPPPRRSRRLRAPRRRSLRGSRVCPASRRSRRRRATSRAAFCRSTPATARARRRPPPARRCAPAAPAWP